MRRDADALDEVIDGLSRFDLRAGRGFDDAHEPMRRLLRSDLMVSYDFTPSFEALQVNRVTVAAPGSLSAPVARAIRRFTDHREVKWPAFNILAPEPWQRNQVYDLAQLEERMGAQIQQIRHGLFRPAGLDGLDQLRVLVCDGASLLSWVGAFREQPFTRREHALLKKLIPAMRQRLRLGRELEAGAARLTIEALLEKLGTAAFVLGANGRIHHCNQLGARLWHADRARVGAELKRCMGGAPRQPEFEVTSLIESAGTPLSLAIQRRPGGRTALKVRAAAARWGLTPRQTEVLGLLVRGDTNRTIGAALKCSERTVEVHLTAIFGRAQVASRAGLVAMVLAREA